MPDLPALLDRIKAASGKDRQLDRAIWLLYHKPYDEHPDLPRYTDPEHIGAVIAMIERELPDWSYTFAKITNAHHMVHPYGAGYGVTLIAPTSQRFWLKHASLPLAALAAFVEAMVWRAEAAK